MIDKKTILKSIVIIMLLIITIITVIQIGKTLARYETTTTTERDVDVAFWVIDNDFKTDRLVLNEKLYPKDDYKFEYTFTVSNFNPGTLESNLDDKIAETDIEYDIVLTTTTNLPLNYEITRNGETYTNLQQRLHTDSDGTVYKEIKFGTTENPYPLLMNTIVNDGTGKYSKTRVSDTYVLKVTFPQESYVNGELVNNRLNLEYPDLIEDVKIELSARQVVE